MKTKIKLLVGLFLAIAALNAQATLSYCNSIDGFGADDRSPVLGASDSVNGWTDPTALTTGDMKFRTTSADNCYGVASGNDDVSAINLIWDGAWTLLAKDNTPDGTPADSELTSTVAGVKFTLAVVPQTGATSGTWTLSWSEVADPGLPITMDIAGVLKASDQYSTYLFLDQTFTTDPLTGAGEFTVTYNKGTNVPNLSHLSLYYRDVTSGDGVPGEGTPGEGSGVPEPSTLALLGLGMIGGLFVRRQRAKRA